MSDKRYRECMAEITAILKRYDMAGAITVVDKERAMFRYHFPTWSVIALVPKGIRFKSKREDFPSREAQHQATELSAHIVMQMRDIAFDTFMIMDKIGDELKQKVGLEHVPGVDFDPEYGQ